jgi:hypothetical protein
MNRLRRLAWFGRRQQSRAFLGKRAFGSRVAREENDFGN